MGQSQSQRGPGSRTHLFPAISSWPKVPRNRAGLGIPMASHNSPLPQSEGAPWEWREGIHPPRGRRGAETLPAGSLPGPRPVGLPVFLPGAGKCLHNVWGWGPMNRCNVGGGSVFSEQRGDQEGDSAQTEAWATSTPVPNSGASSSPSQQGTPHPGCVFY